MLGRCSASRIRWPRSSWRTGLSLRASRCARSRRSWRLARGPRRARAPPATKAPVAPGLKDLADRLSDVFETRVKVELGQRKGKIVVEFASLDDLERIVRSMSPALSPSRRPSRSAATSRPGSGAVGQRRALSGRERSRRHGLVSGGHPWRRLSALLASPLGFGPVAEMIRQELRQRQPRWCSPGCSRRRSRQPTLATRSAYGDDPADRRPHWPGCAQLPGARQAYLVFTGTAANILGLSLMLRPFEGVICADTSHVNVDECGAAERLLGCKLLPVPTPGREADAGPGRGQADWHRRRAPRTAAGHPGRPGDGAGHVLLAGGAARPARLRPRARTADLPGRGPDRQRGGATSAAPSPTSRHARMC